MRKIVYKQKYFSVITKNSKRGLPKKGGGAWTVCRFKKGGGWLGKKKGVVFLRGELIPQCTLTLEAKLLKTACNFPCMCKFILVHA